MAGPTRFELAPSSVTGKCPCLLDYGPEDGASGSNRTNWTSMRSLFYRQLGYLSASLAKWRRAAESNGHPEGAPVFKTGCITINSALLKHGGR